MLYDSAGMRDTNSRTGIKGRVEYETDNWKQSIELKKRYTYKAALPLWAAKRRKGRAFGLCFDCAREDPMLGMNSWEEAGEHAPERGGGTCGPKRRGCRTVRFA